MSNQFNREDRYLVLKYADLNEALSTQEQQTLLGLANKIESHRTRQGKSFLQAVVVEKDWPEYEPTWKAIEARAVIAKATSQ